MDGRACTWRPDAVVEGVRYKRIPSGEQPCHDCSAPAGGLHHPGCCEERCPRCVGQAIGCGCRWEDDEPDPDFDPADLNAESPEAVRA